MANAPKQLDSAYGAPLQQWNVRYDQVLALRLAGHDIETIAQLTSYSPGHVRRILDDPRARQAFKLMRQRMMGTVLKEISEQLVSLAPQAVENLRKTIEADIPALAKGKKHQDDVSFELLSRVGFGKKDSNGDEDKANKIPKELADKLVRAIEQSDKAREIEELPEIEVVAVDSTTE